MTEPELIALLALQKVEGVGDVVAKKLLNHCGTAEAIFKSKSSQLCKIEGIGTVLTHKLKDKTVFEKAEKELQFIKENQINTLYFQDKNYPAKLKHCLDGPILIFSSGQINLNSNRIISIVGTRNVTSYGAEFCKQLIADLAPLNPIIVSGFAYGVDIVAHQSAIDHGLQTIGVVAHGLNQIYPKQHKKYISKIEQNGGFITDFWSSATIATENFVRRNRIVAGMSEATLVIESAEKGGSLITANLALDYHRDVFAVPGRTTDKYSQGCNTLIKTQRAHLLTSAADLIYMMNWDLDTPSKTIQKQLFVTLEDDEQKIYNYLQENGTTELDNIALSCDFPVFKTASILLAMELKGVIRPLPGKLYEGI